MSEFGKESGGVAMVVLGCRNGDRRSEVAARTFHARGGPIACVVASGGRAWRRAGASALQVEADALAEILIARGVPADRVVRERCSHSTRENAVYCARILERRHIHEIVLVTHDWHAARAVRHFENLGLRVEVAPVPSPSLTLASRIHAWGHERIASWLDRLVR